jgi:Uma2 family endonuclease
VWIVDPDARTVDVYTSPDDCVVFPENDTLDGGEVLPGLALSLSELFGKLDEGAAPQPPKPAAKRRNGRRK